MTKNHNIMLLLRTIIILVMLFSVCYGQDLNVNPKLNHVHGYMSFSDSTITIDLTQNEWATITNGGNIYIKEEFDEISYSYDTLIIDVEGDYFFNYEYSTKGDNTNDYSIRIMNNTTQKAKMRFTGLGVNNYVSVSLQAYFECEVGDKITVQVRNVSGSNAIILLDGTVFINRIH